MDKEAVELAKAGVRHFEEFRSPAYDLIRAEFVGRLATSGRMLDDMRQAEIDKRRNYNVVHRFMETLPQIQGMYDRYIPADNAYTARLLQATVLWSRTDKYTHHPYYIIGERVDTSERYNRGKQAAIHLLLYSAHSNDYDRPISEYVVWDSQYDAARKMARARLTQDFTEEEMQGMFDKGTGMLQVRCDDSSLRLNNNSLAKPPKRKTPEEAISKYGMSATSEYPFSYDDRHAIPDSMLADYDIFTHLNELATAFGKTAQLQSLLDRY